MPPGITDHEISLMVFGLALALLILVLIWDESRPTPCTKHDGCPTNCYARKKKDDPKP